MGNALVNGRSIFLFRASAIDDTNALVRRPKGIAMSYYRLLVLSAAAALLLAGGAPAFAQTNNLVLESLVELERSKTDAQGVVTTSYGKPDVVVPGDRVRITLLYNNRGAEPVTNLKLRNPIPEGLQYDGTTDLAGFSLSIDKGQSWGQLGDLTVTAADGSVRAAAAADVTDVMWVLPQPVAPAARGSVTFFTRVR